MKAVERNYNMSNAALAQLASDYVVFMTRDATEFAARGVDAAAITAFETLGNAFEVFPTDEEYLGLVMIEVDAKNILRDTCTDHIQLISGYFEQEWGNRSGQYKRLGISNITRSKDKDFLYRCREVVRMAEEYLADLTPIGLTQLMIDALETDAQSFEDRLNNIADKTALRDSKTEERTEKGNELYEFVKQYSTIGKLIWENVNESKYNDYVIYKTPHGGLGKVMNLSFDVPTMTASWDALQFADDYQLEYKPPTVGAEWQTAYEGAETSTVFDPELGSFTLRCRGHNAEGYGEWSDELVVIVPS